MSVDKIDWVEKITTDGNVNLEPVQGKWGLFYAGSDKAGFNCIIIPFKGSVKKQKIGLFEVLPESILYHLDCIKIEWDSDSNDSALLFIDDLLRTEGFLENPISVIHKKRAVWKKIDVNTLKKYLNELTGLWGEMAFVERNPDVAEYWVGPGGTDRDFSSDSFDLEIKTTRKKSGREVGISSIDQMACEKENFYLLYNSVEFSSEEGESLNSLFEAIKDLKIGTPVNISILNQMKKYGKTLSEMKFRLRFSEAYEINEKFPVITSKLIQKVMGKKKTSHLTNLKYSVNLAGLSNITEEELLKVIL